MTLESRLDAWSRGWRGPLFAALLAFLAGLPGLLAMPPLDRDESRFAQATAQMLETDDLVVIKFQDQPRFKKPVGIHWLQAASVSAFSAAENRGIWAYRIPSLLGAMLAAAACAWGAAALFDPRTGLLAGSILGATFLLSTEAFIAKTDAALCGSTTLAMAALAKMYADSLAGRKPTNWTKLAFWSGLAVAALIKGRSAC
jgi:4-amino-4-deoxy-L-arabinose transferase-like glycosyltransferase